MGIKTCSVPSFCFREEDKAVAFLQVWCAIIEG